ncbi:hypothetical protein [Roseococcus sp. YIM B11640]|uniref:hypothetical protein n=1 Tax=Roseococcus sp. YIM B11640 TaxID=3133973 RepID=UPI003C7A4D31
MTTHRYHTGQNVSLVPGRYFGVHSGPYRILRALLNDGVDFEYHVKHVANGHERMVRQSEILAQTAPG